MAAKGGDLFAEIEQEMGRHGIRTRCKVALVLEELDAKSRAGLLAAIETPRFTAVAIAASVRGRGLDLSEYSVTRHRLGRCRCGRAV